MSHPVPPPGPPPSGPPTFGPPTFGPPPFGPPPFGPPSFGPQPRPVGPRRDRSAWLSAAIASAIVVVGAAVLLPVLLSGDEPAEAEQRADLSEVQSWDDLSVLHTEEDVEYPQVPPAGGSHDPRWLECGVYDAPVRDEHAVHSLEHGTTWITHDPDLPADEIDALADLLPANGILSPYDGLRSPVVVTVWGRQLALDGPEDPRLDLFLREYGGGETAPEPFASCAGGVSNPEGEPGRRV